MSKTKRKGKVKQFFEEFKKFITRGNVLDMAVGVIVGGAFTAIVNGLSNFILKPIINWLLAIITRGKGLEGAVTFLDKVTMTNEAGEEVVDLANSIYIDWGAFISAIINFLLIAFVFFALIRVMNRIAEAKERALDNPEWNKKKAIAKIRFEQRVSKKEAIAIWETQCAEAKAKAEEEKRVAQAKAEEEKRIAEEKAMANTRLLEEIRDLLKQK